MGQGMLCMHPASPGELGEGALPLPAPPKLQSECAEALDPPEEEPPPAPALPAVSIEEEETKVLFLSAVVFAGGDKPMAVPL